MTQYASDPVYGSSTTGDSTVDQVKDQVREKAQVAQDKAQQATGKARGKLRDQVDQRSTQAGEQVSSTAQDVRSVAEELRNQGKDTPARLAEQAADRVEYVGNYLRDADADRILRDVEDFARRQPWAVVAGGLALGFAASRFLKASSSRRYQSDDGYGDGGYGRSYAGQSSYATGAAYTSDPAYTGSDYGTERSYTSEPAYPTTDVPPVAGTYDPLPETTSSGVGAFDDTPGTTSPVLDPDDDPYRTRRDDPDPLT